MTAITRFRQVLSNFEFWHLHTDSYDNLVWRTFIAMGDMNSSECDEASKRIASLLMTDGWTRVGSGHFALVVEHPDYPGRVFKVSHKPADSYLAYAMWARDNAGLSRHLPTIHNIVQTPDFVLYELDKLTPMSREEYDREWLYDLVNVAFGTSLRRTGGIDVVKHRDVLALCERIGEYFQGVSTVDLHHENLMFDNDGTIIITDPVSFREDHRW